MRTLGTGCVRQEEVAALVGLQDTLGKLQDLEALRHALRRYAQHRGAVKELRAQLQAAASNYFAILIIGERRCFACGTKRTGRES